MSLADDIYQIADELRAIANMGLYYAEDHYNKERYGRVLSASARLIGSLENRSAEVILELYQDNMNHISPIIGAEAVVMRQDRMLLIKRGDNGLWAMPGGLVEIGETLAESAQRELSEEAHVEGKATRLLGVFDSRLWSSKSNSHLYFFTFQVDAPHGDPMHDLPETTDVGFFAEDELPPLSPGHQGRVPLMFQMIRGEVPIPHFDPTSETG